MTRSGDTASARRGKAIRTPKAAAIAGIVFAILLGVALILIRVAVPADSREAGDWVSTTRSGDSWPSP